MRKLFLSAVAVFIYAGSPTQLLIAQFIASFAFGVVALLKPYADEADNLVAAYSHAEIVLGASNFLSPVFQVGAER